MRLAVKSVASLIRAARAGEYPGCPCPREGQGWRAAAVISRYGRRVGTWGPGAFDNDDALDLLGTLAEQDAVSRRATLERIFRRAREHPEDLNWTFGPGQVVAAAAVVAAGLPEGQAVAREITAHDYDMAALVIPGDDPELADVALAALLITVGRDGAWHQCWVDAGTALQARQTTDQLASVFYRYEHRHDQELPLEP